MGAMATLLPGLLLSGLQAAASKRQKRRLVVVAALGVVAPIHAAAITVLRERWRYCAQHGAGGERGDHHGLKGTT